MTGIPAQSPAKGWGAFDPGLDPGEEWAKGGVRLRGPSPWRGEGPKRQTELSAWLRQRSAKDPKGKPSVPSGFASGARKTRKANRAFRLASPAEREREAPPRSGDKAFPPMCHLRRRRKNPSIAEFGAREGAEEGDSDALRHHDELEPLGGLPVPRAPSPGRGFESLGLSGWVKPKGPLGPSRCSLLERETGFEPAAPRSLAPRGRCVSRGATVPWAGPHPGFLRLGAKRLAPAP